MIPITILHLSHSFLPVTQNWIYSQLQNLPECRSLVLCRFTENGKTFPWPDVYAAYPRPGINRATGLAFSRLTASYAPGLGRSVIEREHPQILHGHFAFESWRNIGLVRASNIPLVTTFYGFDVDKLPRRAVWRRRYARLFHEGAAFITEGQFMAGRLRDLGCPNEKIRVVKIGIDLDRIKPREPAKPDSVVNVLFVGLSREKKGPLDAAAAFARAGREYPGMVLHLVGDGAYRARAAELLKEAGMLDKACFHGMLPYEAFLNLLGKSDILLAPSVTAADGDTEGGAPVSVIEALAAAIPVVATSHCDIPNIVNHGTTGLLSKEHDIAGIAAHLGMLAGNPAMRFSMGRAGRLYAEKEHDIRMQAAKIRTVYEEVLRK
jgi:colanic acid/amylovoran biosynthesis glycosyltransferase